MSDMMATAATFVTDQLAEHLSQLVSIARGNTTATTGVAATKCPVNGEVDSQYGIFRYNRCDWIIKASAYQISAAAVEPQKNDTITEAGGDVWLVTAPSQGEDSHRPFDPQTNSWRVHTKRITDA